MDTQVLTPQHISLAAQLIRDGKLVAFPTETVYGLGANALDEEAVKSIFVAKGRPQDNPLIVHVSSVEEVARLVTNIPEKARVLMTSFWPGPLSIVFDKNDIVPSVTTAGLDTVVIRMPNHKVALELIKQAAVPLAAPSANSSGKPSPTQANHVLEDLKGKITAVLDAGSCEVGVESTVVDVRITPSLVLRQGGVTLEQLREVIGSVELADHSEKQYSPGTKYRHYAPLGKLVLVKGEAHLVDEKIRALKQANPCALVLTREDLQAQMLFKVLREARSELILCPSIPEEGLGATVMERLEKAASEILFV